MPIAPLVADDDSDLVDWQAGKQSTFLDMACHEIRKFCGWHIAPSVSVTNLRCWFGARNYVMLPSTYVTSVDQVTIDGQVMIADMDYFWDSPKGWVRRAPATWPQQCYALVSFTHGYDETPPDVKAVIFEVLATAMELPASNASRVQTMQYNFELNPDIGVALSRTQKERLSRYKIRSFGGPAGP